MIEKPKPKFELLLEKDEHIEGRIDVTCHSEDARRFAMEVSKEFGTVEFNDDRPKEGCIRLYKGYDCDEVIAYLNSYNHSPPITFDFDDDYARCPSCDAEYLGSDQVSQIPFVSRKANGNYGECLECGQEMPLPDDYIYLPDKNGSNNAL